MWIVPGLVTRMRTFEDTATGQVGKENIAESALEDTRNLHFTNYRHRKHEIRFARVGIVLAGCLNTKVQRLATPIRIAPLTARGQIQQGAYSCLMRQVTNSQVWRRTGLLMGRYIVCRPGLL